MSLAIAARMMTRHEFLRSFIGLGLGLGVGGAALAACGTDTGTGDPNDDLPPDANQATPVDGGNVTTDGQMPLDAAPPTGACASASVAIGSNHGHSMTIAPADLSSTSTRMYAIQGTSDHPHAVTITPAQFATLRSTGTLTVTSSTDDGHPHTIKVTCA
jgi:hypothetical protein